MLPADSTSYHDPGPYNPPAPGLAFYRVYAATSDRRSEYSDEAGTTFPVQETPPPSFTPAPSNSEPTATAEPSAPPTSVGAAATQQTSTPSGQQTIVSQTPSPRISLHPDVTSA